MGKINGKWLLLIFLVVGSILFLFANEKYFYYPLGPFHSSPLFLDMNGRLSAMEADTKGFDVRMTLKPNPLDPHKRPNIKPSYTLALGKLGVNRTWLLPASIITVALFVICALFLVRPKSWFELFAGILIICSPPILLGLERANDDVVLFNILFLLPPLLAFSDKRSGKAVASILICFLTPAKYYPAVGFGLFFHKRKKLNESLWWCVAGIIFLLIFAYHVWPEIKFLIKHAPSPCCDYSFGSKQLFQYAGMTGLPQKLIPWLLLALAAGAGFKHKAKCPNSISLSVRKELYFLLGAGVLAFCFWLRNNYDYRLIFIIFCLPYLFELMHHKTPYRLFSTFIVLLTICAFWIEGGYFILNIDINSLTWDRSGIKFIWGMKQSLIWLLMTSLVFLAVVIFKNGIKESLNQQNNKNRNKRLI